MSTLLIVRPEARAQQDIAVCRQLGWDAVAFNPIEIEPDETALAGLAEVFQQCDAVFWVSPTAIEIAAPHVDFSDGMKVQITVGEASRRTLSRFTQHEIFSPTDGNDSEAVLRLPIWQNLPQNAKILVIRGHGGRDFLIENLRKQGFGVAVAEVYFRRPKELNWQDFPEENVQAAYITSAESVKALFEQVPPALAQRFKTLLYLTHHERVADALRQAGAQNIQLVAALDAAALSHVSNGADMSQTEDKQPEINQNNDERVIAVNAEGKAMPSKKAKSESVPAEPKPTAAEVAESRNTGNTMSDNKNTPKNESSSQTPAPVVIQQSSGKGLAVGALVLALLGLGASGFLFVQGQNVLRNQELAFTQKIDKAALGESENASLLKDNISRQTTIQAEIERLANAQKANSDQIELNQKAYQELVKGRVNWLVDESESMLNLAAQQLMLSGNVPGAVGVLEHVNSRLSRFDQPELLPIKQAISSDLAELKNRPYVDVSGTALRIDRLETAVAGLPLVVDGTLKPGAAEQVQENPQLSWWENAWEKSLGALKGLVEVRNLESNDSMLLSPEQIYFVRENLRLRLLDARTALLQHNGEVYQSDLNNVEAAVKQYFDNKSPATQSWLKELAELKALDIRMTSGDALKNSLAAVRAYQDGSRVQAAVAAAPVETEAAEPKAASEAAEAQASAPAPASAATMPEAPALPSENKASQPQTPAAPAAKPEAAQETPAQAKGEQA
ncbi:uroporphyrinogen-III synthase [Neisseria sp. N95_16]|uniref:Uroporphyrinogen-III synthase n=2 Tax=Neisseriaceae TaxID=481 RepID=A0A7X2H088_9NEIS|nr:uroporphyrinogen-III synthase [Neisseria brasiliensis]PJO10642.1 uroporphyrinogen-III synthase [Neisseria sp. N95_16]